VFNIGQGIHISGSHKAGITVSCHKKWAHIHTSIARHQYLRISSIIMDPCHTKYNRYNSKDSLQIDKEFQLIDDKTAPYI